MTGTEQEPLDPWVRDLRDAKDLEMKVCYHEGAHAVACLDFGIPIEFIEMGRGLFGGANGSGQVATRGTDPSVGTDEFVISFLVGTEAERYLATLPQAIGPYEEGHAEGDMRAVNWHLREFGGSLPALRGRSAAYVVGNWARIEAVAAMVLRRQRIAEAAARRAARSA